MTHDAGPTDRFDQALTTWLAGFLPERKRELLLQVLLNRTRHLTVVVEDIYQSHNASACLRSCDCFGVQDVHVIENYNSFDANERVTRGTTKWLTIERYSTTRSCLTELKARDYAVVMTSPDNADCSLETWDIRQPTALVFGNEHEGVSQVVRDMADHVLNIPMYGFAGSFNVSVAVSICLHHLTWRMRDAVPHWQLPLEERTALLREWVRRDCGDRLASMEQQFRTLWDRGDFSEPS